MNEAKSPLHYRAIGEKESKINWQYFFGGGGGRTFDRYYKAEANGILVEKHVSNQGVEYSIGNIDTSKTYKTENALLNALKKKV